MLANNFVASAQQPVLVITNPAPVCLPSAVDITVSYITSGSALPTGTTLSYYTDAAATIVLAVPNAIYTSGTYYIKAANSSGLTDVKPVTVTINPSPVLTITNPAAVCSPGTVDITNPAITAGSFLAGGATFIYYTDAAATTVLVNPAAVAASGTYYIKASTALGCSVVQPITVTVNLLPIITVTSSNPTICAGSNGSFIINGLISSTTYKISYSKGGVAQTPQSLTASVSGTITISGLTAGNYTAITATAATGCQSAPQTATLSDPIPPSPIAGTGGPVCAGGALILTATPVVGATYIWIGPNGFTSTLENPTIVPTSYADSGNYTVTATLAGCSGSSTIFGEVHSRPYLSITNPAVICAPGAVDITNPAITAGSTYLAGTLSYYTNAATTIVIPAPNSINTSGTYYIKALTSQGCSNVAPVTVTINPLPVITLTSSNPTTCAGSNGSFTINGLLPATTYSISYSKGGVAQAPQNLIASGSGTITISGLTAASYTAITAISPFSCPSASYTLTLSDPSPFVPVASCNGPLSCGGSILYLSTTTTAGATYSWTGPNGFTSTIAAPNIPSAIAADSGAYTVAATVTGCTASSTVVAVIHGGPVLSITNPAAVNAPSTVDITASAITAGSTLAGATLSYYTDAAATLALANPTAIAASGTYYIEALTGNGCMDIKPVTVTINTTTTPVLVIQNPDAVCSPYTVDITNPSIAIDNSILPANTTLNYYKDAAGTIAMPSPQAIAVSGTYYIKATVSPSGSNTISPVVVTIYPAPSTPIVSNITLCQRTTALPLTATANPGSTLLWYQTPTGGVGTSLTPTPSTTNTDITAYYVAQVSSNGCESPRAALTVTTEPIPTLTVTNPAPVCSPAVVDITAPAVATYSPLAGTILSYYSDANATSPLTSPTAIATSGTYYIEATTPSGCIAINSVVVSVSNKCKAVPVSVYPNPANQTLSISFNPDETGDGYFELINDKGQVVIKMSIIYSPLITINIASMPEGKYYYVIRRSNGQKLKAGGVIIVH